MVVSLYRKSTPARRAWAPAWCESVSTTSNSLLVRRVGLPESVPKEATPEMLDRGADGIGRRRLQVAVRELDARLVDRAVRTAPRCR